MAGFPEEERGARLSRLAVRPNSRSFRSSISNPNSYSGYSSSPRINQFSKFIVIGVLLVIIGIIGYLLTMFTVGVTLIPAIIGLMLIVLRFLGRHTKSYSFERFFVHCSAIIGLLGFLGALLSAVYSVFIVVSGSNSTNLVVLISSILTVLLCGVFCLKLISNEY